jgi:hypothetical protein
MRLNLPERQAYDLRALQKVQGKAVISVLVAMFLTADAIRSGCIQGASIRLLRRRPSSKNVCRPMWAAYTGIRVPRSSQSGLNHSSDPA